MSFTVGTVDGEGQANGAGDLKGPEQFCDDRKVDRGYVITKDVNDFSIMPLVRAAARAPCARHG